MRPRYWRVPEQIVAHAFIRAGPARRRLRQALASCDYLWSHLVMKQVRIAELKARLSEFLRGVQRGESLAVLDRNTAIAYIVPITERTALRVRKPPSGAPTPNKVPLPRPARLPMDIVDLLLEERQSHR